MAILRCSRCGRKQTEVRILVDFGQNFYMCNDCIVSGYSVLLKEGFGKQKTSPNVTHKKEEKKEFTETKPSLIHKFLDDYIIGQENAKKIISVAVYNHYKRIAHPEDNIRKSNILMIGPSGTGKTEIARTIAKFLDVPFAIADATTLTEAGYVGDDVENVLLKLIQAADGDIKKAEKGIIYIDEIDKISRASENRSITRDVSGEGVQQALLKIIEGAEVRVPYNGGRKVPNSGCYTINTNQILFICAGAFEGLDRMKKKSHSIGYVDHNEPENENYTTKDIIKYGLIPELIGRLPIIVETNPLTKDDLKRILIEPKNSVITQYIKLLEYDHIHLEFEDSFYETIIEDAIKNETGARGLKSALENRMTDIMYKAPELPENTTIVLTGTGETIKKYA